MPESHARLVRRRRCDKFVVKTTTKSKDQGERLAGNLKHFSCPPAHRKKRLQEVKARHLKVKSSHKMTRERNIS